MWSMPLTAAEFEFRVPALSVFKYFRTSNFMDTVF